MPTRSILAAALFASSLAAQNPVPFLQQPLLPSAIAPGGPDFVLTVNGSEFVPSTVVQWNGHALATAFVSSTQVKAQVPAEDTAKPGMAKITAVNRGGMRSNESFFFISDPGSAQFRQRVRSTNDRAGALVTADFNADGKLDLAFSGQTGKIEVLLGKGDGTFQEPVNYSSGQVYNFSLATGDFNRDGKLDLATTSGPAPGLLVILLGNGDGTFQPHQDFLTADYPEALAVGDFNRDGMLDAMVVTLGNQNGPGRFSLLLGKRDGTFQPHHDFPAARYPNSVVLGDFNGDGSLDLALVGGFDPVVNVFLGNGNGSFQPPIANFAGETSGWVTAADLNGDGKADLVETAVDIDVDGVVVLLSNGDGTFSAPVRYDTPSLSNPVSVVAADLDADGKVDLVTADDFEALRPGSISILLGNGDGTFQTHRDKTVAGIAPEAIVVGDFNRDGKPDLALDYSEDQKLSLLRGR